MFLMNWFENKHRFGGLTRAFIKKTIKGYIFNEKKRNEYMKIDTTKGLWI